MYKVGMGYKLLIFERLSFEGKDFFFYCLESDLKMRWIVSQFFDYLFVKVCIDEE